MDSEAESILNAIHDQLHSIEEPYLRRYDHEITMHPDDFATLDKQKPALTPFDGALSTPDQIPRCFGFKVNRDFCIPKESPVLHLAAHEVCL